MFSATFSLPLQNSIKKFVKGQVFNIIVKSTRKSKDILTLKFDDGRREDKLLDLLASDIFNPFLSIIFCKTNDEVKKLFATLKDKGYKQVGMLNKDMNQREINKVVKQIETMDLVYLIATDKVARGMDFPGVSHIVNYSLPADLNYFKHRIGRTDREGGASGDVYLIFGDSDKQKLDLLAKKNKITYIKTKV
jgi:ATP-dependent RNA helicase CshB